MEKGTKITKAKVMKLLPPAPINLTGYCYLSNFITSTLIHSRRDLVMKC